MKSTDEVTPPRRAAYPAVIGSVALTAYALSESVATHRVWIAFDAMALFRILATCSAFGFLLFVCGLAAPRFDRLTTFRGFAGLTTATMGAAIAYLFLERAPIDTLAYLAAAMVVVCWRLGRDAKGGSGWLAWAPLLFTALWILLFTYPPIASPWLVFLFFATIGALLQFAFGKLGRSRFGASVVTLGGIAGSVAMPWPKPTHYPSLKILGATALATVTCAVCWRLLPAAGRRATRVTLALLALGTVGFFAFALAPRTIAFGPFSTATLVGKTMVVAHPRPDLTAAEEERRRAAPPVVPECPEEKPEGVLWIVIDALRPDAVPPGRFESLDRFSASAVRYERAYAPAPATFASFATWLERRPDVAGVPWTVLAPRHANSDGLTRVIGDDIPRVDLGPSCTGEGERAVEILQQHEPGSLALLYLPVPHTPYHCENPDDSVLECYRGAVACAVRELEPVFAWARENPRWAVALTADHGESLGAKNVATHAVSLWEEQVRVPLIVRAPGWEPAVVETAVSNAWLGGTFGCWLADNPLAFAATPGLLEPDPEPRPFAMHGFAVNFSKPQWGWGETRESAVIRWPHKAIVDHDTGWVQVFDLEDDPDETTNLAVENPALAAELRDVLSRTWGPALTTR